VVLKISEREVEALLKNEEYSLIQKLIERRSILQIEVPDSLEELKE